MGRWLLLSDSIAVAYASMSLNQRFIKNNYSSWINGISGPHASLTNGEATEPSSLVNRSGESVIFARSSGRSRKLTSRLRWKHHQAVNLQNNKNG